MQLRDYQSDLAHSIRLSLRTGRKAPLVVAPTGSGKTVLFSYIADGAGRKGKRVMILVHRQELLDQTSRTLREFDVQHGMIAAGRMPDPFQHVQLAAVQTVIRRPVAHEPDIIVVDEAHHATAGSWKKVIERFPRAVLLGFTATPERLDGKGLADIFDDLIRGPEVRDLIQRGFLCPPVYFAPPNGLDLGGVHTSMGDFAKDEVNAKVDKPTITGDAVEHYRRICHAQPAIAFCASIKHAEHVAEAFRAAGYRAAALDGTLTTEERRDRVRALGDGRLHVMTSCEIVSEGFDLPVCSAAILLRPTKSLALHLQQIGRVLRVAPNKPRAIILDHVGNLHRHGLAEDVREWSLEGANVRKAKKQDGPEVQVRQCPECFACHPPAPRCPECGHTYIAREREIEQVNGTLTQIGGLVDERHRQCPGCQHVHSRWDASCPRCGHIHDLARARRKEQRRADTYEELVQLGRRRGYKRPEIWARHVFQSRQSKRDQVYA